MSYKFEHVAITVNSIEETARWYEANLGFKREEIGDKPVLKLRACKIRLDELYVEILEPYSGTMAKRKEEGLNVVLAKPGINHMAFCVPDINEAYRKMRENGVHMVTEIRDSKYFCKDNNGISLEIR